MVTHMTASRLLDLCIGLVSVTVSVIVMAGVMLFTFGAWGIGVAAILRWMVGQ